MEQFGPIRAYYADLISGQIQPEDMRIESLPFRAEINAAGQVFTQSDPTNVISRYNFVILKVLAWIANPFFAGFAPGLMRFNLKDQGRNFDVFKLPQFLHSYVGSGGTTQPHDYYGCFITVPGSALAVDWTIDTVLWASQVGAYRMVGVDVTGDYVNCGQPRAPSGG